MRRVSTLFAVSSALLLLGPASAEAQSLAPGAPLGASRGVIAEHATIDTFLALVPPRAWGELDAEIANWTEAERSAEGQGEAATSDRDQVLAAQAAQAAEVRRLDQEIQIARDMEQGARREALEDERRLWAKYGVVLDARVEAFAAEMAVADRRVRHARAVRKQLVVEKELEGDRAEWRALHNEAAVVANADERRSDVARAMEQRLKKYFEATREAERERERLALAERELAELRLQVLELRRDLLSD